MLVDQRGPLADRLRAQATRCSRTVNQLRREFLFQRFLTRMFADTEARWILRGGA
jgi:hypothetical protein